MVLDIEKKVTYEKTKFGNARLKPPKGMSYVAAYNMNFLRRDTSPIDTSASLEDLNAYYRQLKKEGKWQFEPRVVKPGAQQAWHKKNLETSR